MLLYFSTYRKKIHLYNCLIQTLILFYRVLNLTRLILINLIKSRENIFEYNLHESLNFIIEKNYDETLFHDI